MITLGCDPDTHTLAIAICDGPELLWFWQSNVPRPGTKGGLAGDDAVAAVGAQLVDLAPCPGPWIHCVEYIAVEQMQVYPGDGPQGADTIGKNGIDGLIRVASTGGLALAWAQRIWPGAKIAMPTAETWKGPASKPANHRARLKLLTENNKKAELLALPKTKRGHVMDAVGIAIWADSQRAKRRDIRKSIMDEARLAARTAKKRKRR